MNDGGMKEALRYMQAMKGLPVDDLVMLGKNAQLPAPFRGVVFNELNDRMGKPRAFADGGLVRGIPQILESADPDEIMSLLNNPYVAPSFRTMLERAATARGIIPKRSSVSGPIPSVTGEEVRVSADGEIERDTPPSMTDRLEEERVGRVNRMADAMYPPARAFDGIEGELPTKAGQTTYAGPQTPARAFQRLQEDPAFAGMGELPERPETPVEAQAMQAIAESRRALQRMNRDDPKARVLADSRQAVEGVNFWDKTKQSPGGRALAALLEQPDQPYGPERFWNSSGGRALARIAGLEDQSAVARETPGPDAEQAEMSPPPTAVAEPSAPQRAMSAGGQAPSRAFSAPDIAPPTPRPDQQTAALGGWEPIDFGRFLDQQPRQAAQAEGAPTVTPQMQQDVTEGMSPKQMALLSVGLGLLSSRNPNFLGALGEAGQQGLLAYAGMQRQRRRDASEARQEKRADEGLNIQRRSADLAERRLDQQDKQFQANLDRLAENANLNRQTQIEVAKMYSSAKGGNDQTTLGRLEDLVARAAQGDKVAQDVLALQGSGKETEYQRRKLALEAAKAAKGDEYEPVTMADIDTAYNALFGGGAPAAGGTTAPSPGQTAVNPQTGERIRFDGSQWVPVS